MRTNAALNVDSAGPHEIFENLRAEGIPAVLLESGGENGIWTFIGIVNTSVQVPEGDAGLLFMRDFVKNSRRAGVSKEPGAPPFTEGFAGFVSYEGDKTYFVYVDKVFAFKHAYKQRSSARCGAYTNSYAAPKSNFSKKTYLEKIRAIKEYLYAGETYQVNFSQRFETQFDGDAFDLYQKITSINPSSFQFFMETPEFAVISNSPERLMRISADRAIETRPIKGTAPRGKTPEEDAQMEVALLASQKERAELTMIVDLARNDLGKICRPGSVEVTEHRTVERYSHVMHTVSNVRGRLENNADWYDALRALHPGGSITGCPKLRTMEIIAQLENCPRGIYCGTAGYIDISGACDFNIMIRTMLLEKSGKGGKLTFHGGGGIVVDSDPLKEYEEVMQKSQAILAAIYECS